MRKHRVLYNPLACNNAGLEKAKGLSAELAAEGEVVFEDITEIGDIYSFLQGVDSEDQVIVAGGDGTLNRLVNDLDGREPVRDIYYYPCGSGNDFMADMADKAGGDDAERLSETIKYATIIVSTAPILALYPFLQKYFTKGVMVGAVKG